MKQNGFDNIVNSNFDEFSSAFSSVSKDSANPLVAAKKNNRI